MHSLQLKICFLLLITFNVFAQDKFNIFKSYANAEKQPLQYSKNKKHLRHSIDEYLEPIQKKMLKIRKSQDKPSDMFDSNWSGFNLKENSKSSLV